MGRELRRGGDSFGRPVMVLQVLVHLDPKTTTFLK